MFDFLSLTTQKLLSMNLFNFRADISKRIFIMRPTFGFIFFPRTIACLHSEKPTWFKFRFRWVKKVVRQRLLWVQGTVYTILTSFDFIIICKINDIKILATHPKWLIETITMFLYPCNDEYTPIHFVCFFYPHNIHI